MRVKIPSNTLYGAAVPETTVEVGADGEVTWEGERIGYVWKGTRTYSPPTHRGSRIARYHKQVPEWKGHKDRLMGMKPHWGDTRQYVIQTLLAHHINARQERQARITYLEQALTPGTEVNAMTTFYEGKGAEMRAELAALKAEAARQTKNSRRHHS